MDHDPISPAPSSVGDDAFRDLALRLLAMYHPPSGGGVPEDHVELIAGRIAPEFPSEVPMPPGSRVQGSFLTGQQVSVVFDCDLPLERLHDFYSERLPAVGWSRFEPRYGFHKAGFVSQQVAAPETARTRVGHIHSPSGLFGQLQMEYHHGDDGPSLHITAIVREQDPGHAEPAGHAESREGNERAEEGPADVRLTLVHMDPTRRVHQRMMEQRMPDHLPIFSLPPGAHQQEEGNSYSSNGRFTSTATLYAAGSDVAAVGRHYNEQLARVGWTPSSAGALPPAAWSTWTLTDREGEPWWAALFALQLPAAPERYLLTFRAEMLRPDAHAGRTGSFDISSFSVGSSGRRPPTPS
jgi:hypothetical protein